MQFIGTGDRILTENFNVGYLYTITFKTGIYINSACIGIGDTFVMFQKAEPDLLFTLNVDTADEVDSIELYDSGGGTNNYDDLVNRPQINSHTLTGNMSGADLGLQNTISDLDTIRSGAAAGATAVQPAALADYQPVISDLDTIRAGAAAGATAVQPADMTSALAAKQDALSSAQLAAVNSGITSTDVAQITTNKNNILLNARNGVSNYLNTPDVTISASGYVLNTLDCNIPKGDYYLKYTSTQTVSGNIQITLKDSNNTTVCDTTTTSVSGANLIPITLTDTASKITIYSVRAGTYSNLQIISKPLYDAGLTDYQPYAPSNRELYEMILALQ